jgi:hypothetical protein
MITELEAILADDLYFVLALIWTLTMSFALGLVLGLIIC